MLPSMLAESRDVNRVQTILHSIRYSTIHSRRAAIPKSFADTYEWIFSPDEILYREKGIRVGFPQWLRAGNGVFWISGKAGSGKSTLMKFLSSHSRTMESLQTWAGDATIITAAHYFWYYGSELERSQVGLFRALLFEILRQCPSLLPSLCTERWQTGGTDEFGSDDWTLEQLSALIDRLSSQTFVSGDRRIRFCFFVDGLDEYDGDHDDIIKFLKRMSACNDIKICASSRPWNVFRAAFSSRPDQMLTLQDLTYKDISNYVKAHLTKNESFARMSQSNLGYLDIVKDVTEKAQGVFLWVFLVVRELVKSLHNEDSLYDVRRRVERIPPDLEPYFRRMFQTIDEFYEKQTARTFLVCV